jgi:hypothetical protein
MSLNPRAADVFRASIMLEAAGACADNRNGTSIVFVTAEREVSKLQKMKQSTSAGIGPATITMPAGERKPIRSR